MTLLSRLTHASRLESAELRTDDEIDAFIDSRALEYPTRLEDEFVKRALDLGVDGGMILDVGTRVGLIALKILWQNENFYAIGVDTSGAMIERARETAEAWSLGDRAFFHVADARKMRLKSAYFDLAICDSALHCFDNPRSVLLEINRVLKPKGALLIRELQRPSRLNMKKTIEEFAVRYGGRMRPHSETALRGAFTRGELQELVDASGLERTRVSEIAPYHLIVERTGESDPNSWIKVREQYR